MNNPYYLLLIPFLFFASCKDPDMGLSPDELIGTHFTDTFTIISSIILLDTIKTSNTDYLLVGEYDDPKFGIVKAESYVQVQRAQFNTEFGTNRVLDSIVLYLDTAYFYGDRNNVQTIEIYQLDDDIYSNCTDDDTCYNFNKAIYGTQLLGSISFTPSTLDTNIINIKLDDQLGIEFLNLDSATLSTDTLFIDYFKGIALVPQNISAVCRFTIKTGETAIKLFYNDSLELKFQINTSSARFNHIESDITNTAIGSLTSTSEISTEQLNDECYLQAGIGIKTKIKFPYLDIFKDSVGDVAINKAELIISDVSGSSDGFTPPDFLFLFEIDTTKSFYDNNNKIQYELIQYSEYIQTNSSFILTAYFQDMLYKKRPNNGLIISPSSNNQTVNRLLFGSNKHLVNPMKLKVYYTVIK